MNWKTRKVRMKVEWVKKSKERYNERGSDGNEKDVDVWVQCCRYYDDDDFYLSNIDDPDVIVSINCEGCNYL